MRIVVDDASLLAILTKRAGTSLAAAAEAGEVICTGSWYYRLHRALHDPASAGSLSTMAAALSPAARNVLFRLLDDLPPEIAVPGPRVLVPVMGALGLRRRVNFLTAEALAAALLNQARIRVATETPLLRGACAELAVPLEVAAPHE
jgi:hypothetical protein